eukprot:TRINITY_DN13919_c1_g1_i1.p1 TRINITY_DN13919_c1_g1~~TRINITY_DN13919_c1_g1_i1.p1  ORF type:complete len:687 (-),score=124.30 TRINITY_DN13919_c1_g1_i1:15-1991(-)
MPSNHKLVCARAARHEFGEAFQRAIGDYRGARLAATTWTVQLKQRFPDGIPLLPLSFLYGEDLARFAWDGSVTLDNAGDVTSHFQVMARTRPLQPEELEDDCYESGSIEEANKSVVVHDGRVHRDGRTLYSQHSRFCLDKVFGEKHDNNDVFRAAAKPLLDSAVQGSRATLVFFGQTGTGKTHTAQGVLDIMTPCVFMQAACVEVLCYELAGTRGGREAVFDLLADRAPVKCLTGEDGNVHVRGARAIQCRSSEELVEAVRTAFSWRTSESTERNATSSRSHCVLELQFPAAQPAEEALGDTVRGGVLRVIDLAGSERNFETQMHTKSMAERGGHINYSLLMLKECARIMHLNRRRRDAGQGKSEAHVPFRSSRLTHLLKSCFMDESHQTTVVATLSPSPTDVEHSLNTLQHVGMMRSARAWESFAEGSEAHQTVKEKGFHQVEGRGHALHSKQQDARKEQLSQFQFRKVLQTGGSIMRKYEPENMKTEAFIDERWHRELNVKVEDDLWVLKDADAECTQVLTSWREEQWTASKVHDLVRWDAPTLQAFLRSLPLPGEARLPSTMTGAQVRRLGRRGLRALCSDEATAQMLYDALQGEEQASKAAAASHRGANAKITALGQSKVYAALPEQTQSLSSQRGPNDLAETTENSEQHQSQA